MKWVETVLINTIFLMSYFNIMYKKNIQIDDRMKIEYKITRLKCFQTKVK